MAYPTGVLSTTLQQVDNTMIQLKDFAARQRDRMAAGSVPSTTILDDLFVRLRQAKTQLQSAASVPGLAEYARAQKSSDTLDVVTEFQAVVAAIDAVTAWITANFPKDANGFLLARTLGESGPVDRQFTSAATATLRTQLDALIATID